MTDKRYRSFGAGVALREAAIHDAELGAKHRRHVTDDAAAADVTAASSRSTCGK